ncbi:MAG: hypothetical protein KDC54_05680 [Lewinella sp.]|nr:hypothetical protein [Lewinella sp.]
MESDEILDSWEPSESDGPIITLRYFYHSADAHLARITLQQAGIPSFITSDNSQTMLPTGPGWIGLNIRESDAAEAVAALQAAQMWDREPDKGQSWRQVLIMIGVLLLILLLGILFNLSSILGIVIS